MSTLVLPQSMVADRDAGIKANAQHVDDNFNALANAVNGKLDLDGTSSPTADISMASHKLTNLATPTVSGDAATKGYVDSADTALSATCVKLSGAQTVAGVKTFSSSPVVPAPTNNTDAATKKYVDDNITTLSSTCVKLSGAQTITGTKTFNSTIVGSISGNAATATSATSATKATQDGNGNNIVNTYAPKASPVFTGTPTAPTVSSITDNSTKLATTKFVLDALKAMYPVNSIYVGTSSTCPLASLFGTWTRIATKIVTAVNSSASITGSVGTGGGGTYFVATDSNFTQNTYPGAGGYTVSVSNNQTISGASATVSSTELTLNLWKRTA